MKAPPRVATPCITTTPAATAPPIPKPGSLNAGEPRRLNSKQLFGPAQEIEISHGDAVYRLRRTALGKLILTK